MPSVKVLFKPASNGDSSLRDMIAAVKAATSNRVIPRANPTRDANGKLVAVQLNLPVAISNNDLAAAIAAINANPGMAVSSKFPILAEDDCTALVQDAAVTTLAAGALSCVVPNGEQGWQGAAASESVGGTGSALRLSDLISNVAAQSHPMEGSVKFEAAANGLSLINGFEISGAVKRSPTMSGVACGSPSGTFHSVIQARFAGITFGIAHHQSSQYYSPNGGKWQGNGMTGPQPFDIENFDFLYFKLRVAADGSALVSYGTDETHSLWSYDPGNVGQLTDTAVELVLSTLDTDTTPQAYVTKPLVLDKIKFAVLDGNLV